jgi:hypothetical protein
MKKIFYVFAALAVLCGGSDADLAQTKTATTATVAPVHTSGDLVSLLPNADIVATVNIKRALNDALPQVLATQPGTLTQINGQIDEIKTKTGIDIRSFEQLAMAMKLTRTASGDFQGEPIALLRGGFNADALLAVGKLAAGKNLRQEKIGDKTVLIFTIPQDAKKGNPTAKKDPMDRFMESLMSGEVAVVSLDGNTLAAGKLNIVRSMLTDTKNRLGADLVGIVNRNPNAVMNFAGIVPANSATIFGAESNVQVATILNSLRHIFGSVDVAGGSASMMLAARTSEDPQAEELQNTLLGLKQLGAMLLGNGKDEKMIIVQRLLNNTKITRTSNEVQIMATAPQADIDALLKPQPKPTPNPTPKASDGIETSAEPSN